MTDIKLSDYIKSDLHAICGKDDLKSFFRWYFFPQTFTFPYIVWFRIVQKLKKSCYAAKVIIGIPAYLILQHFEWKYDIHANTNIQVGKGFRVVHGSGVYLNCAAIGDNFTVYQGVTLGSDKKGEIPRVGNNVTIDTGAVIAGGITLEDGCTIGANSFVNKNVLKGSTVGGIPAREIGIRE